MTDNRELISEIDSVLSNPVSKQEIEKKLVNSRSNSRTSRSGSKQNSFLSAEAQNESLPGLSSAEQESILSEEEPSVLQVSPNQVKDSVVHEHFETPDSLIASPINDRQAELNELHEEIQRLTEKTTARSENNSQMIRREPEVNLERNENEGLSNYNPVAQYALESTSVKSQNETTFSTQYISELERENTRIKKTFLIKEISRLRQLAQQDMYTKEEVEYIVDKSVQEYLKQ